MLYNGQIVDNTYQIIEEIGSGGMGVVYLAYHLRLEKYIVMKKIKGNFSDMAFIRNEVDILKQLHHPYLPQVYDFIEYNGDLFSIIDYIDGYDLNYYINNNYSFSEGQLIKWLAQLCQVLDYLHSQTPPIIHMDIKPGNIIVTGKGDICLIDFGISLNNSYDVKGLSKNYASPEQVYNVNSILNGYRENCLLLDERTDIYSLGITFYHLMTGVKPEPEYYALPELSQYNLNYSEPLIKVIEKSIEYDREQRFSSASEMLKAINNMRKYDSRYKKYLLVQVLSSFIFGIMLISGIALLYHGNIQQTSENYQKDHSEFIKLVEKGDFSEAINKGNSMINNPDYNAVIDKTHKAELLYAIADCCYETEDFNSASDYYEQAIEFCQDDKEKEKYYRDYCLALINNDDFDTANSIATKMQQEYPNSESILLVEAVISYYQGDYTSAVDKINASIDNVKDKDNKYLFYIIKGDCLKEEGDYKNAVTAYESAVAINDDVSALRKLGNAYLACANEYSYSNTSMISKAKDCFKSIYDNYYSTIDDVINLAQSYRLLGDNEKCISTLSSYLNENQIEDFRIYMQMAIAAHEAGDPNTAVYCQKAYNLYQKASSNSKESLNNKDFSIIKNLYENYCNSAW